MPKDKQIQERISKIVGLLYHSQLPRGEWWNYAEQLLQDFISSEREATEQRCVKEIEKLKGVYLIETIGINCRCGKLCKKNIVESEGVYLNKIDVLNSITNKRK